MNGSVFERVKQQTPQVNGKPPALIYVLRHAIETLRTKPEIIKFVDEYVTQVTAIQRPPAHNDQLDAQIPSPMAKTMAMNAIATFLKTTFNTNYPAKNAWKDALKDDLDYQKTIEVVKK